MASGQDLDTFSTRFRELVGVSPSVYREQGAPFRAGMLPCIAKQLTRTIRKREARSGRTDLS